MPDSWTYSSLLPLIAKSINGVLRDSNDDVIVFDQSIDYDTIDDVARRFSSDPLSTYTNTLRHAPFWFEQFVDIARINGTPIEWRLFTYRKSILDLSPKREVKDIPSFPRPPQELVRELVSSGFRAIDLALSTNGDWVVLTDSPGEMRPVPEGGSANTFYESLSKLLSKPQHIPSWCWCPAGRIVEHHELGERRIPVEGSRHFAAGTKVYISNAFFGDGAERCVAIGKPKYSEHVVGVVLSSKLVGRLELEKVTDEEILSALYLGKLQEKFGKIHETNLFTHWGSSDEDMQNAQEFVEYLNRYRGF